MSTEEDFTKRLDEALNTGGIVKVENTAECLVLINLIERIPNWETNPTYVALRTAALKNAEDGLNDGT